MIVYTDIEHDDHGVMSLESSDTYSDHGMTFGLTVLMYVERTSSMYL